MSLRLRSVRALERRVRSLLPTECQNVENTVRATGKKTRTVNNVGLSFDQRSQHRGIFPGIVFKICVLDYYEISRGFLNSAPKCGPLANISGLQHNADFRVLLL